MPIRAIYSEGRYYPSVLCDYCEEKIEEASTANALWDPSSGDAFFVHTPCSRYFESSFRERLWWEPLDAFLHRVLFNSGFQPERAKDKAEMLGQFP